MGKFLAVLAVLAALAPAALVRAAPCCDCPAPIRSQLLAGNLVNTTGWPAVEFAAHDSRCELNMPTGDGSGWVSVMWLESPSIDECNSAHDADGDDGPVVSHFSTTGLYEQIPGHCEHIGDTDPEEQCAARLGCNAVCTDCPTCGGTNPQPQARCEQSRFGDQDCAESHRGYLSLANLLHTCADDCAATAEDCATEPPVEDRPDPCAVYPADDTEVRRPTPSQNFAPSQS
eukprot:SAG22_NODE_664_length_8022_cov_2.639576_9_plen_230_part_00